MKARRKWMIGILLIALVNGSAGKTDAGGGDFLLPYIAVLVSALKGGEGELLARFRADKTRGEIPLTVKFDASGSTGGAREIVQYDWDFGDGHTRSGKTVSHTYTVPGDYKVGLLVLDTNGQLARTSAHITVVGSNSAPTAVFTTSFSSDFAPKFVEFDASASTDAGGQIVKYSWNFGDGASATGRKVTHEYASMGVYSQYAATLTVTDDMGATDKAVEQVFVSQPDLRPVARFEVAATTGSAPLTVRFDASEATVSNGYLTGYSWDFDDGHRGTGLRPKHVYTTPGSYFPALTVTDNNGAQSTVSREITVDIPNHRPIPVFSNSPTTAVGEF